jgi:O-6-methylguanine DNA methyltransferase
MPLPAWICNHFIVNTFYAYCVLADAPSPWGPVRIAATERGVVAVSLLATTEAFEADLARRGLVIDAERAGVRARALAGAARAAVEAMVTAGEGSKSEAEPQAVAGLAAELEVERATQPDTGGMQGIPIDLGDRPAWDCLVLEAVRAIPRGQVASYGEVARRIGRPGAARAVGGAVGRNPVGLLVPCHRVIAADGSLGGYGVAAMGGRAAALDLKRALLALEGVEIRG